MRRAGCEGAKVRGSEGARVRGSEGAKVHTAMKSVGAVLLGVLLLGASVGIFAQGRGGRGGAPVPTGRLGAPVDLVGTWVSVVTEDWQWRMRTAPKGDTTSVPLNGEGRRVADTWEPSMDGRCEAFGAGGIMRMPLRLKISWQDDLTLKIESDAGQQTRLLQFAKPGAGAAPSQCVGTHAPGHVCRRMATQRRCVRCVPRARRRRRASAVGCAQGHDHQRSSWLAAPQRRALQSERDDHGILHARDAPGCRRLVRGDNDRRGSDVPGSAVHDQLELQERGERLEVESNAMSS